MEIDEGAAKDNWTVDCLGAGGSMDMQAMLETTEKALDSLLANGAVEDMRREDAVNFKCLTTRWKKGWAHERRRVKARFVARECMWPEHREDLFSPWATHSATRVIDFTALKLSMKTLEVDAVDPHFQAREHEEVVVEPSAECLERPELGKTRTLCGDRDQGDDRQGRTGWSTGR